MYVKVRDKCLLAQSYNILVCAAKILFLSKNKFTESELYKTIIQNALSLFINLLLIIYLNTQRLYIISK